MEENLKILTSRQRRVYLLRQEGLTFKAIGEQLGIHSSAAAAHMRLAERRQVYRGQKGSEWLGAAPYCVQVVKEFAERTQMDLYGAVRWRPFEE